jgi:hypothetical protein
VKPITLELRVDANGQTGETVRTSDGDEFDLFVRGFLLFAMGDLEPGDTASLSVTRVAA